MRNTRSITSQTTIPAFDATTNLFVSGLAGQKYLTRVTGDSFYDVFGRTFKATNYIYIPATNEIFQVKGVQNMDRIAINGISTAANNPAYLIVANLSSYSITNNGSGNGVVDGVTFKTNQSESVSRPSDHDVELPSTLPPIEVNGTGTTLYVVEQV